MDQDDVAAGAVGYIKYTGLDVERGIIDAASAGSALIGLDQTLRYFNSQQSSTLSDAVYELPIYTRSGSWEVLVLSAVTAAAGTFAFGYAKKAGEKLAENDFKDIGLKDVLAKSLSATKSMISILKHTRNRRGWDQARFSMTGEVPEVVIPNERGELLSVPAEHLRWLQHAPNGLMVRMTSVVRANRVLVVGLVGDSASEEAVVDDGDKPLFDVVADDNFDDGSLFPELLHGSEVTLEGRLIRGNEASNSMGLEYQGHVINCVPSSRSIRQYKAALFLRCRVTGVVTRQTKSRFVADRRPTLVVERLVPLEYDRQPQLF